MLRNGASLRRVIRNPMGRKCHEIASQSKGLQSLNTHLNWPSASTYIKPTFAPKGASVGLFFSVRIRMRFPMRWKQNRVCRQKLSAPPWWCFVESHTLEIQGLRPVTLQIRRMRHRKLRCSTTAQVCVTLMISMPNGYFAHMIPTTRTTRLEIHTRA